jgi:hypothetical protein
MSEALILEFQGTQADYDAVNEILGIDPATGQGDWPVGLLSHVGAEGATGNMLVLEVWDSQESQGNFMATRLGPALGKVGMTAPTRQEWLRVMGTFHTH